MKTLNKIWKLINIWVKSLERAGEKSFGSITFGVFSFASINSKIPLTKLLFGLVTNSFVSLSTKPSERTNFKNEMALFWREILRFYAS